MWQAGGSDDRHYLSECGPVLRRFSNLAMLSVAALLVTGFINAWFLTNHLRGLIGTPYGELLQIKIALFLAMLCFAAINRLRLLPRLAHPKCPPSEPGHIVTLRRLRRNTTLEIALGLAILYFVGLLGVTPPAGHAH
jgi:putative copper resistance protein D